MGVILVLQGIDTGIPNVRVGILGTVRRNYAGGGWQPCGFSKAYHWKQGTASGRWDLGNTGGRGGPTDGGDAVDSQVYCSQAGNRYTPTRVNMCKGNRLQVRGSEAKFMVEA